MLNFNRFIVGIFWLRLSHTIDSTYLFSAVVAIAIWMAVLWVTEIIPLVVTAFLPIVLFPMFGILSSDTVTGKYAGDTIFLFIAGVFMAMSLERWDLHVRISLKLLSWFGSKPPSLMLGFMVVTFILSMFVSNTATTIMLVPNAIQVIRGLAGEDAVKGAAAAQHASVARLEKAVLLAIAYSASMGGMASLLGELTDSSFLHLWCTSAFNLTFSSRFLYTEMNRNCHKPCLRRAIPDYFPRCNRNIFYQMAWFWNPHWCDYVYVHLCLSLL